MEVLMALWRRGLGHEPPHELCDRVPWPSGCGGGSGSGRGGGRGGGSGGGGGGGGGCDGEGVVHIDGRSLSE